MQEALHVQEPRQREAEAIATDSSAVMELRGKIEALQRQLRWLTSSSSPTETADVSDIQEPSNCPAELMAVFRLFRGQTAEVAHGITNRRMVLIALGRLCMNAVDGECLTTRQLKKGSGTNGTLEHAIKKWHKLLEDTQYFLSVDHEDRMRTQRVATYKIIPR
jgi:hypothetical protein